MLQGQGWAKLEDKFHIGWEKRSQTKETLASCKAAAQAGSRPEVGGRCLWQTHTVLIPSAAWFPSGWSRPWTCHPGPCYHHVVYITFPLGLWGMKMLPAQVTCRNYDSDACVLELGHISSVVFFWNWGLIIHFVGSILQKWKFAKITNFSMVSLLLYEHELSHFTCSFCFDLSFKLSMSC